MAQMIQPNALGERILAALDDAGRKRAWLAVELDVHPDTLDRWITGRTEPSWAQMMRVAVALDKPITYFAEAVA